MGTQSITAFYRQLVSRWIVLLLLLFALPITSLFAQTSVSAITIPLILPTAIVFDSAGNLYIAETANQVIRKVDTTGHLTTIAGSGAQGYSGDNGPATAALLDSPQGLALDNANNLYIADTHNHAIRRLNLTTAVITTIAGHGSPGYSGDNGPATDARLDLPTALVLDSTSSLYFTDSSNHRIRRIDAATGIITTVAGTGTQGFSGDSGPAIAASIDSPNGLAVDAQNNLYLSDTHNHRIRRIDAATGIITTIAGNGTPGYAGDTQTASASTLALPHGLTLDASGNIFFADTENHRIRRIDAVTGIITTIAGNGTQGYYGDNGPATAASLDSPRATALSPSSLVTLSDTGNQRIRQLTEQPSAAAAIQTIAGLGSTMPGALTLTAPSVIAYGTGILTASLSSTTPATGVITFLEAAGASTSTLGTASLASNTASLATSTMAAGLHNIIATYPGDQTHASAQSLTFTLTIAPQPLVANINPITLIYGQSIPTITGSLAGLLPQDASRVVAAFTTTAANLSPVGTYPLTATITGPASANYSLSTAASNLTITPARAIITLTDLLASAASGTAITFTTQVSSTTAGEPTGTVTLLDGTTPLFTAPVSHTGTSTFTTTSLAQGSHTLIAVYNGDKNFTAGTSTPSVITVGTGSAPTPTPDFTMAATGSSTQTIVSGSSASFNFAVQLQGSLASPITLAATGLPNLATASFNPATLPPGGPTAFILTVATPNTTAFRRTPSITWAILLLPLAAFGLPTRIRRGLLTLFAFAVLSLALTLCSGCGDRINAVNLDATPAKTYTITVTGTATTAASAILQHSATVTLILQNIN
jgi:sugar lactone lactonase YvrE